MKINIIIDFMHIYYKYFFEKKYNKICKLTAPVEINGVNIEKDTTLIYHSIRDIENVRAQFEREGHDVVMNICFDSKPTFRAEIDSEYKAKRVHELTEDNHNEVNYIMELLKKAGHTVHRKDGYESDDLVTDICQRYKDKFDFTVIYTNDKDLAINVCDKVTVLRFKQKQGYSQIKVSNYEQYLSNEFGARIPYNSIGLYLSTKGDTPDGIKGIKGFGNKAFDKLMDSIKDRDIDWSRCGDYNYLESVMDSLKDILNEQQFNEMKHSFKLVRSMNPELGEIQFSKSTVELREEAYKYLGMISLIH